MRILPKFEIKGKSYVSIRDARIKAVTQDNIEIKAGSSTTSYVHKEHKFRLQAFLIKILKKEKMVTIGVLAKLCQDKFMSLTIEKESVENCLQELMDKEFISHSNDLYIYIA